MSQAEQMMNEWLKHRNVLEELLESIKDEHIDFKPWDGAMALGELALHIAGWNDVFVSMVKTEKFASPDIPKCETMADVCKAVKDFTEKTKARYELLTDAELEAENNSSHPKLQGPKKNYLTAMYDHEIHHKGQLFMYARMAGVKEVPFFR
ncbi:DinB family protein [Metabacillus arenae]|uniref:DinB family protein n=1 Tax=Metabacillus arenae TaxID=2771434 RepID=A0A926RZD0_9BACI|nr:DinB family protein [Metabacillus arenae]MBD1382685.1 DinB family protein [Metabacillus arenae]